jgi:cellulose synthase/poly-beta-1,6-N-acetylglucosamine synthase-like glycosyltransferase
MIGWEIIFWTSAVLWLYAQFGYPLLLMLVRIRRSEPNLSDAQLPGVSLIIPAFNEEGVLNAKLANALAIDYPSDRLEILVASDGSHDRTVFIAESYADRGVRLLAFEQRRGKASVLNDAIVASRHAIICLCDANVMFEPAALRRLVAHLADGRLGAASGEVRIASHESNFGQGESSYYRIERKIQQAESEIGSMMGVDGGMYVVRRELFQPLPSDTILDDFVISMRVLRAGSRIGYVSEAIAHENGTATATQEFRRRVRVAAGAVQSVARGDFPPFSQPVHFWQYLSHKLLRWLGPLWLAAIAVSSCALVHRAGIYRLALGMQLLVYGVALVATFSLRLRATRFGGACFYLVMSHVAMAQGLLRGVAGRQAVTWTKADRPAPSTDPMLTSDRQ